jgi:Sulfatase-modifying factor enzyme 1
MDGGFVMKRERTVSWVGRVPVWLAMLGAPLATAGACNSNHTAITPEPAASTGGSGGSGGSGVPEASDGSGATSSAVHCPSGKGPAMVLLPAPDGSQYCMDIRETTRAEYDAFVTAKAGDTSGQPAACSWNKSFTPALVSHEADTFPSPYYCYDTDWNNMRPNQAVGCVDFCDALAYCEWAGKRLCGQVGKGAERINDDVPADQDTFVKDVVESPQSEFMNACTEGGKTTYPYGNTYEPGVCIDPTWMQQHGATALDVTDTADRQCHGSLPPFSGVYDLTGSVGEWQNMCTKAGSVGQSCVISGPSWGDKQQMCDGYEGLAAMQSVVVGTGFRCCADPVH